MNQEYQYTVCTWCLTFNHAPYIMDTLRGFCMQETNFPVINVIIDDCSTDGEEDVIDSFVANELDINDNSTARHDENDEFIVTFARHKTNQNCFFVIYYYKENHYSIKKARPSVIDEWKEKAKYVAFCEGDDYWIHPLKLQRQVDFMEENPDFSMCFHNAVVTYDNLDKASYLFNNFVKNREFHLSELLDKWICPTQSLLIRNPLFPLFPIKGSIIGGDWRVVLHCAANGRIWGMKAVMACYRKTDLPSSLSNAYSRRSDEIFLKKVPVLVGFDEYTGGKYHDLVSKYISYYLKMGQIVAFKKKHGMLITCLLKPLTLMEMFWKRSIRPRIDKNAPTYSA